MGGYSPFSQRRYCRYPSLHSLLTFFIIKIINLDKYGQIGHKRQLQIHHFLYFPPLYSPKQEVFPTLYGLDSYIWTRYVKCDGFPLFLTVLGLILGNYSYNFTFFEVYEEEFILYYQLGIRFFFDLLDLISSFDLFWFLRVGLLLFWPLILKSLIVVSLLFMWFDRLFYSLSENKLAYLVFIAV